MELNDAAEKAAQKHVDRSLAEMTDDGKVAKWSTGERAAEQADEIVATVVAEALNVLEQRSKEDGQQK